MEVKVVLAGTYGVGKSALFRRFFNNTYNEKSSCWHNRLEVDNCTRPIQLRHNATRLVEMELWDTAGMERYNSLPSTYYASTDAVIIVYNVDIVESVHKIPIIVAEVSRTSPTALIYLCGNKVDGKSESREGSSNSSRLSEDQELAVKEVGLAALELIKRECENNFRRQFEISCKTGEGIQSMFYMVANDLADVKFRAEQAQRDEREKVRLKKREQKSNCC